MVFYNLSATCANEVPGHSTTTDAASRRRPDLLRDKQQTIASFFSLIKKTPAEVEPTDVKLWQAEMEGKPLAKSTVYHRISLLSSFYLWAMRPTARPVNRVQPGNLG